MSDSTFQLLRKHFDLAIEAPDGIAKMRELILTLAMQGKLVPQDPKDPPARELLREIEAEKNRLAKEGKIKAPKPLRLISQKEVPFAVPKGWEWVRYFDINDVVSELVSSFDFPTLNQIAPDSIEKGTGRLLEHRTVSECGVIGPNNRFYKGQILYSKIRPSLNKVVIAPYDGLCSADMYPIRTWVDPDFMLRLMLSEVFLVQVRLAENRVKMPKLNLESLGIFTIPLPPLPEQRRIVAKIDQLMAVCDDLEKKRDALVQKRLAVHNAAIRRLLEAEESSEFSSAWDFLVEHFGEVYSVKENVAELRKAILQLAVMGKLVKQDPNDPPANELLKQIEAEKRRLVKEGKIKAPKPLPPIETEEVPFTVPVGWAWVRLGETILQMDAGWSPQCGDDPARIGEWGVLKTTAVQELQYLEFENKLLPEGLVPRPDAEVFDGDILITRAGPKNRVGICCVASVSRSRLMLSDKIIRFRLVGSTFSSRFVALSLTAGYGAMQIEESKSGMAESQVNISQDKLRRVSFAVPPLPEQHRIVAKVDELMALCDTLERQIEASTSQKSAILNAVLAQV